MASGSFKNHFMRFHMKPGEQWTKYFRKYGVGKGDTRRLQSHHIFLDGQPPDEEIKNQLNRIEEKVSLMAKHVQVLMKYIKAKEDEEEKEEVEDKEDEEEFTLRLDIFSSFPRSLVFYWVLGLGLAQHNIETSPIMMQLSSLRERLPHIVSSLRNNSSGSGRQQSREQQQGSQERLQLLDLAFESHVSPRMQDGGTLSDTTAVPHNVPLSARSRRNTARSVAHLGRDDGCECGGDPLVLTSARALEHYDTHYESMLNSHETIVADESALMEASDPELFQTGVEEHARRLGIDPALESDFLWIARGAVAQRMVPCDGDTTAMSSDCQDEQQHGDGTEGYADNAMHTSYSQHGWSAAATDSQDQSAAAEQSGEYCADYLYTNQTKCANFHSKDRKKCEERLVLASEQSRGGAEHRLPHTAVPFTAANADATEAIANAAIVSALEKRLRDAEDELQAAKTLSQKLQYEIEDLKHDHEKASAVTHASHSQQLAERDAALESRKQELETLQKRLQRSIDEKETLEKQLEEQKSLSAAQLGEAEDQQRALKRENRAVERDLKNLQTLSKERDKELAAAKRMVEALETKLAGQDKLVENARVTGFAEAERASAEIVRRAQTEKVRVAELYAQELFAIRDDRKTAGGFECTMKLSILEVYNETIVDLLESSSSNNSGAGQPPGTPATKGLDMRMGKHGVYVDNLIEVEVFNENDVIDLMKLGHSHRSVGSHDFNEHSSRSHLVLSIQIETIQKVENRRRVSKLHLIDLAGSERVSKTAASGQRLKEAQNINRSLSALGDVIAALGANSKHVPYRNSKLTFLLQDSLSGNSKVLMFVNVSPVQWNAWETLCSLNFASRCRNVALGQAPKQQTSGSSSSTTTHAVNSAPLPTPGNGMHATASMSSMATNGGAPTQGAGGNSPMPPRGAPPSISDNGMHATASVSSMPHTGAMNGASTRAGGTVPSPPRGAPPSVPKASQRVTYGQR
ncbi:Kinesin-like protein, partial [Globisporangium splendens]